MTVGEPQPLPEIRVRTLADLPLRSEPEELPSETASERLAREWLEAWHARREATATMARLRVEIEAMLGDGLLVGNHVGYVVWQTSRVLKADPAGLFQTIGERAYLRVSEVSATRLRELLQAGLLAADAECLRSEEVKKLVTKLK